LENGEFTTNPCLQTHPRWVAEGWIQGAYTEMLKPTYVVKTGDLFFADIAFLKDAVEGNVKYEVLIQPEEGDLQSIAELAHRYGEGIKPIRVDLTPYAGQKLYFVLKVDAGDTANYDWACWVRVFIYRYP
jgi:hypothetical protein